MSERKQSPIARILRMPTCPDVAHVRGSRVVFGPQINFVFEPCHTNPKFHTLALFASSQNPIIFSGKAANFNHRDRGSIASRNAAKRGEKQMFHPLKRRHWPPASSPSSSFWCDAKLAVEKSIFQAPTISSTCCRNFQSVGRCSRLDAAIGSQGSAFPIFFGQAFRREGFYDN